MPAEASYALLTASHDMNIRHYVLATVTAAAAAYLRCVVLQAGATAMFMTSSAIASWNGCNAIFVACRWAHFFQWTCWNTVSVQQPCSMGFVAIKNISALCL